MWVDATWMVSVAAALADSSVRSCEPPTGAPKQKICSLLNYHTLKPFVSMWVELTIQELEKKSVFSPSSAVVFNILGSVLTALLQLFLLPLFFFSKKSLTLILIPRKSPDWIQQYRKVTYSPFQIPAFEIKSLYSNISNPTLEGLYTLT